MKVKNLFISILIPVGVGIISAILSNPSIYSEIVTPPLAPPGFIFPIVWTILYILMGISSYIIFNSNSYDSDNALLTYIVQLIINGIWPILFFNLNLYFISFLWIILLIVMVISMISKFYKIDKRAAYLQIPYLIWLLFAAYLNLGIFILN